MLYASHRRRAVAHVVSRRLVRLSAVDPRLFPVGFLLDNVALLEDFSNTYASYAP